MGATVVMVFGDNLRRRGRAIATWSIAAVTCASFASYALVPGAEPAIIRTFGFIPFDFSLHPVMNVYRLVTAEFMHLSLIHLIGNLIFLIALGRAVEGAVGSLFFASAFIGLGALGFLGSWLVSPGSHVPIVGNSGAVSFQLGGYVLLFPQAKVRLIPFLRWPFLRAWAFAAVWLALQARDTLTVGEAGSGIAYWTHFAGFAVGLVAATCWREFAMDTERLISEIKEDTT
jgi:membrane associated rhomboid family serine protease